MYKRTAAAILWFLAASYAWAFIAEVTGVVPVLALPVGVAAALFVLLDPLRRLSEPS
jgi:hypothetical protein